MKRFCVGFTLAFAAFMALNGCVAVRSSHGYVLERGEESLHANVGLDTKDSVLARYGAPSMVGTFDNNSWYYMTSAEIARAFFRPKTRRRAVVAFRFDEKGVVKKVEQYDLSDGLDIKLASDKTPTRGKELSFWEQLLGNVGQLPPAQAGQGGPGGQQQPY